MTNKHTPGPWALNGNYIGSETAGNIGYSFGDNVANAHLLAAAPELLAALKAVLEHNIAHHNHMTHAAARAAIAKAEGRS